ncbi:MAG: copper homeostasis protein CutC [Puia sp.]|nr:copper homeostasis protein CutC [Puia sp.]
MTHLLEICSYNLQSALIAQEAGAYRVELCADPADGGTTPSAGLIRTAREKLNILLYPIIRPRGGDFLYTDDEFAIMLKDIALCKETGCDGVVIGLLEPDGSVDKRRAARLVEKAYPMGVTFHRAFDRAANPFEALEDIIGIGCERILTSGQRQTAMEGASLIRDLIRQADERIVIMPGSGVRSSSILELAARTEAVEFHTSARLLAASSMRYVNGSMEETLTTVLADRHDIDLMLDRLKSIGG